MKKNTKIIVAVVVIVLMVAVGCIYGFVLKRDVPEALSRHLRYRQ